MITGFHGLHVLTGVSTSSRSSRIPARASRAHHVELLGLFWCFVDFVWIFVFSFVYLIP